MPTETFITLHANPEKPLFHYTTLSGLTGIVETRGLWASNAHYLNDTKEIRYAQDLLISAIWKKRPEANDEQKEPLRQLEQYLKDGWLNNHYIFVTSFSESGNLLSQWRAYCSNGVGVSIGLEASRISSLAAAQNYRLAKCIYDPATQKRLVDHLLNAILNKAVFTGPESRSSKRHWSESYYEIFEDFEDQMLVLCAVIKHTAFAEEEEWRLISPVYRKLVDEYIYYREGRNTLIPHRMFSLVHAHERELQFDRVYVGPSPNIALSMASIPNYLSSRRIKVTQGVCNSMIPYRP